MKLKNIMAFLVLLLVLGCGGNKEYTPTITSKDIYQGKEGLTMEFFEGAPPEEIFENTPLPIGLRLYNKGAYDIIDGFLSISLEKDYMVINEYSLNSINEMVDFTDPEHIKFDLKGKTIEHPGGEHDIITFTADIRDLSITDPQSEYHNTLVSITSCYKYQTKAVETVCIDTDVFGLKKREKACTVGILSLDSQGAPVAVTNIESEMLPSKDSTSMIKPRFLITVKNLGNGEVVREDRVEAACSSEPVDYREWNIVKVKVYLSSIEDENKLDCDIVEEGQHDDGIITLKGKEAIVRCSYEAGFNENKGTFSSPLYIILDYGYTDNIARGIKIKKIRT